MRSKEAERFTARIRALKDRAGISSSSLHRYCSGTKIPTGYGVVHTFAKACGASSEELRELHRLWALADATRSSLTASGGRSMDAPDDEHIVASQAPSSDAPVPRRRHPHRGRTIATLTITILTATAASAITLMNVLDSPDTFAAQRNSGSIARVRVFNIEQGCRNRGERSPGCSIGLAINPRLNYDAHNVVSRRVWHDDALDADCILYDGDEVTDETGATSTRWYRVQLDDVPGGHAWLSGIRTRDDPALPTCVP
jgi:hypothetical protein